MVTAPGAKYVALAYLRQLELASALVIEARQSLVEAARGRREFALLQTIPHIGEIRASELLAVVGHPSRFRSLRAFWSYAGLGVIQRLSAEHRVENGKIVRDERSRGVRLSKAGQPMLKKVLRDIALHASIRTGYFREVYEAHLARGKTAAIARVALARKVAAVIYAVWRYETPYRAPRQAVPGSGRASTI
jgi:transposase